MKYVINSSDTNDVYSFFLPIVNLLWRERGYKEVVLLVGDRQLWASTGKNRCVLEFLEKSGSRIIYVKQVPSYKSSTIAQFSRLFAYADSSFAPLDYILISDADMLPLSRTWFDQQDMTKRWHFFGGNAYLGYIGDASPSKLPQKLPICYIGARVADWAVVMSPINGLQGSMEQVIKEREQAGCRDNWWYDEETFKGRIFNSPQIVESQFINRNWSGGRASHRLDRDNWNFHGQSDLIDCHFLRPGYKHLDQLYRILSQYMHIGHINAIKDYITTFLKS